MALFDTLILIFRKHFLKSEDWFEELEKKKYCDDKWEKDIYPPKFN